MRIAVFLLFILLTLIAFPTYRALSFYSGKWGFVDTAGNVVVWPRYLAVGEFFEGRAAVCVDSDSDPVGRHTPGRWGYVDNRGAKVIDAHYERAEDFRHGWAAVRRDGKWGFIDQSGDEIVPCRYDAAIVLGEDRGLVNVGGTEAYSRISEGKWGIVDESGKEILPPTYDQIYGFGEGLAGFRVGGRWVDQRIIEGKCGFLDRDGNVAIPPVWDHVQAFRNGLATVCEGMDWENRPYTSGRWGCIDWEGNVVIPVKYAQPIQFVAEGIGLTAVDDESDPTRTRECVVDREGNVIIPPSAGISYLPGPLFMVQPLVASDRESENGLKLWALYDVTGKPLTEPVYTGARVVPPYDFRYLKCYKHGQGEPDYFTLEGERLPGVPADLAAGNGRYEILQISADSAQIVAPDGTLTAELPYIAAFSGDGRFRDGLVGIRTVTLYDLLPF